MSRFDTVVKCFLFLAFCALLVEEILSGARQAPQIPRRDHRDGNAGSASIPADTEVAHSSIGWNLFASARAPFSSPTNNTQTGTTALSRTVNRISAWLAGVIWSFRGDRPKVMATSTNPSEPLEITFEKKSGDSKKAYHTSQINGIDIAYHNPFPVKKVRGVALLLHGCQQQARDWFELPEHRHIAAQLIRKRLGLLAVTSRNRVTGCWSTRFPHWQNDDVERVAIATRQWITDSGIPPQVPIYAIGISSGATMLSVLSCSQRLPNLASQALYISPGNQRAFRNASHIYPSTLFVHVTTDHHYASSSAIASARRTLLKRNVALVGELPLTKVHLAPLTLHEREPRITPDISRKVYAAAQIGKVDMERAMRMSSDPDIVQLWSNRALRRAARQVIRVANGFHEVSAMHADKVVDWLVSNGRRTKTKMSW